MPLQEGQKAPDFALFTDRQESFRLSDCREKSPVLLLFFSGAFTSACAAVLSKVNSEHERFGGEQVQVAGISTDSPFVLSEFRRVHKFQFPLLSDHDAEVSARYGVKYDQDFTAMQLDRIAKRAAFVIDHEGIIRYAEVLDDPGRLPNFEAIRKLVDQLISHAA